MVSILERKKKNMDFPRFEIEELDIYNNNKLIKNVPHKIVQGITSGSKTHQHTLDVVYRIAAICDYLSENGESEFDYRIINNVPEIKEKLNEAKYLRH